MVARQGQTGVFVKPMPVDEEKCSGVFSLNGELIQKGRAAISPQDLAMIQGQAVFETLAIYEGRIFAADQHWKRLERGAQLFGMQNPNSADLETQIVTLLKANDLISAAKARARVTLTAGEPVAPFENDQQRLNVIIEVSEAPTYDNSASVITVPFARNEHGALAGLKTINYGENAVALRLAREAGADEAIFPNTAREVCEGTWSNFFCCLEGAIITPPLQSGCLPGVTREIILQLAPELGIEIHERPIAIDDLKRVDAAALTSTLREIQPVREIDKRALPSPEFEAWKTLSEAYQNFVTESLKEHFPLS